MKVKVTQEHINQGTINRINDEPANLSCPVALALLELSQNLEQFGGVGLTYCTFDGVSYWIPVEIRHWIQNFDNHQSVEPIEFELDKRY